MLAHTPKILIVEDDLQTRDLIARYLRDQSCLVATASNGKEMDRYLAGHSLDLVVLDLMLPGEDGLTLCRRLRSDSTIPIIMLTAKGEDLDRILGLEMGADDYLAKPFNPRELLARINAVLRRQAQAGLAGHVGQSAARLRFQDWTIDLRLRELRDPRAPRSADQRGVRPAAGILRAARPDPDARRSSDHDLQPAGQSVRAQHRRCW